MWQPEIESFCVENESFFLVESWSFFIHFFVEIILYSWWWYIVVYGLDGLVVFTVKSMVFMFVPNYGFFAFFGNSHPRKNQSFFYFFLVYVFSLFEFHTEILESSLLFLTTIIPTITSFLNWGIVSGIFTVGAL